MTRFPISILAKGVFKYLFFSLLKSLVKKTVSHQELMPKKVVQLSQKVVQLFSLVVQLYAKVVQLSLIPKSLPNG